MLRIIAPLLLVLSVLALFSYNLTVSLSSVRASSSAILVEPSATPAISKRAATERELKLTDGQFDGVELVKTDAEWKKELSAKEFYVMREDGTEQPYSGALLKNKKAGTYHCAACGLVLFRSDAKYDSQTGWPSFFQVAFKKNVIEKEDRSLSEVRTEVECARCKAHLGHVFDDGPQPSGLRYCMNSVSLKFKAAK
jgi:peptide-methionine (R)-S-oxide reductase